MLVRFIAHAGIAVEEAGTTILVDPWFLDSTPEHPVIESLGGKHKTIDFQIPKAVDAIEAYAPNAIFLSHFHPHHSPARDIRALCAQAAAAGKTAQILHPEVKNVERFAQRIPPEALHRDIHPGDSLRIGPFTVTAREHTVSHHLIWHIASPTGSVLHVADGQLHKEREVRAPDPLWSELAALSPSLLFLSTGGHALRITDQNGVRRINDGGIFSPVEAAQVASIIAPRAVGAFGFYNHSIWKGRNEYILPAALNEEQFAWALSWLSPEIRNVRLIPSYTFGIGDSALIGLCDTYLP